MPEETSPQFQLFEVAENDWREEWVGMPEYNNVYQPEPEITATFKFRNEEDFLTFLALVQEHIYNGKRVFDGIQRKTVKSAWYPHNENGSGYQYQ
jgi:hypothetical protein